MNDGNSSDGRAMEQVDVQEVSEILGAIQNALEESPEDGMSFVNEFGDFTLAIPLEGNCDGLADFLAEEAMKRDVAFIVRGLMDCSSRAGRPLTVCCFTGHRPKKVPWIDDKSDYRAIRLETIVRTLVDALSRYGIERYIAGNAEGFDALAAEVVLSSNDYLEASKAWEGVGEGWMPPELEIAIPYKGHNSKRPDIAELQDKATIAHVVSRSKNRAAAFHERNEYMVDHADVVIAFLDDDERAACVGGSCKTLDYAIKQGKAAIVITSNWVESGWPDLEGLEFYLPPDCDV